jgi:hypothetical protein
MVANTEALEDRLRVLMSYYPASTQVAELAKLPAADRKPICVKNGINPHIVRTMVDYTRYPEAELIYQSLLKNNETVSGLRVLDFGCLVSDYGIFFARRNARVSVYDDDEATRFVKFRFEQEALPVNLVTIPCDYNHLMREIDLAVFGEVLEHLFDPLEPLQACIAQSVRYIFTSCYPFGDDKYFALTGHRKSAQDLQPECIRLLNAHYAPIPLRKKAVLWKAHRLPAAPSYG